MKLDKFFWNAHLAAKKAETKWIWIPKSTESIDIWPIANLFIIIFILLVSSSPVAATATGWVYVCFFCVFLWIQFRFEHIDVSHNGFLDACHANTQKRLFDLIFRRVALCILCLYSVHTCETPVEEGKKSNSRQINTRITQAQAQTQTHTQISN